MFKRIFLSTLLSSVAVWVWSAAGAESGASDWIPLFDGLTLRGWQANENRGSFKVVNGTIACDGPRSHLFYVGDSPKADFKNFEFEAEVFTKPSANSGIYFHTHYQERDWPTDGFEVQINNTFERPGPYRERKKTGSLYGVRNVFQSIVKDNQWFTVRITVRGKQVQVRVNDVLLVEFLEPQPPIPHPEYAGRVLSRGTFALQCHDLESKTFFRNLRVRVLPDDLPAVAGEAPVVDEPYRQILALHQENFPIIDFHVHLKGGLTVEEALAMSRRHGINYGIAPNCGLGFGITNDAGIDHFLQTMKGQPVFLGMQAEGREWVKLFSPQAIARFDYVFTDSMTFTDAKGKRMRLWIKEEVDVPDKQAFMEMLVQKTVQILTEEPIDIYVNPTFLPECIAREYDQLWSPERMHKVIEAAAKNGVAMEINARYRLPSATFIKLAKAAGVKFSFGTNNGDRNIGRPDYCLAMVAECGLTGDDMFMPKPPGQKPVLVRGLPAR